MLPYQGVEYHPYTAYHISETLQILLFTGLGFFLFVKKLAPEATISLDLDWPYRMGGRAFLWLARKPIQLLDTGVGELYRLAGLVPLMLTAQASGKFDNSIIDGAVDGLAESVRGLSRRLRQAQRGQVQESLAFAFAIAAALIIGFLLFARTTAAVSPSHSPLAPAASPIPSKAQPQALGQASSLPVQSAPSTVSYTTGHRLSPGGTCDNSPTFQRWETAPIATLVPKGRPSERTVSTVPSGLTPFYHPPPNVETLGYYQPSLRDEDRILLSLNATVYGASPPVDQNLFVTSH
jgi:hypothetical protein